MVTQPHLCLEETDVPLPSVPSHAHLLLAVVLLSHEILAAVSNCFVAHFCKSRLMESVPSTTDEETSASLILYRLLFGLSHRRPARELTVLSTHQHTSAGTQMFVFKAGFVSGLLEKAEKRWSFLMGKLGDLRKTEEHIPSEHSMFQQSHRDWCVDTRNVFLTTKGGDEELQGTK